MADRETHFARIKERPGLLTLIDAAGFLSNRPHEGRSLRFAFLYSDGRVWRVVDETISDETRNKHQGIFNSKDFANYVHNHWSVFQASDVVAFVDMDDVIRYKAGTRITKIVRLRNPQNKLPAQLFAEVTGKILDSYVVYSLGDGRVRIFTRGEEIIQWNTRTNTVEFVKESVRGIVDTLLKIMGAEDNDNLKQTIQEVIQEISEAEGEGAMLIVSESDLSGSYLQQMDRKGEKMIWREKKLTVAVNKILLRAMMILDGATAIKKERNGARSIEPRFVVYPHCNCGKAFSVLRGSYHLKDCPLRDRHNNQLLTLHHFDKEVLAGKGSKHHGAANLSVLLALKRKEYFHNFVTFLQREDDNQTLNLPFRILTISADGGIKEWPNVFKGE